MAKIALCQMPVADDLQKNLTLAGEMIEEAARNGAEIVCLPEMFCCPYENSKFIEYAEPEGGEVHSYLSRSAARAGVYLVGGSVPESDGDRIYNTCYVFSDTGEQIAKHRKVHLFDIDIPSGQYFKESDTLTAGDEITVVPTPYGSLGIAICFDIRFAEQFRLMALSGAQLVFVPAAFNMTTGPAHWETLFRARALDNQCYIFGCAPARCESLGYVSYANSIATSPWGEVVARLGEAPDILYTETDSHLTEKVRQRLPVLQNLRRDLYEVRQVKKD